jgi:hypothetical protein
VGYFEFNPNTVAKYLSVPPLVTAVEATWLRAEVRN